MKWTKLTIDTTCEAEDLISAFLEEEGVLGVQIEDNIPVSYTHLTLPTIA